MRPTQDHRILEERRSGRISFRCYPSLIARIKTVAAELDVTMSFVIEQVLTGWFPAHPSSRHIVGHDETNCHPEIHLEKALEILAELQRELKEEGLPK